VALQVCEDDPALEGYYVKDFFAVLGLTLLAGVVVAVPSTYLMWRLPAATPSRELPPLDCSTGKCGGSFAVIKQDRIQEAYVLAPSNPAEWELDLAYLKGSLGVDVTQEQIEILRRQEPKAYVATINGQVLAAK
jgi:hypothetical protein